MIEEAQQVSALTDQTLAVFVSTVVEGFADRQDQVFPQVKLMRSAVQATLFFQFLLLTSSAAPQPPVTENTGGGSEVTSSKTASEDQPAETAAQSTPSVLEPKAGDINWVLKNDGTLVPVPTTASWEDYLKYLEKRFKSSETSLPPFSVTKLVLEGVVDEKEQAATLKATVRVQVNRDNQAVLVPLRMNEAILLDTQYRGDGVASFSEFDRELGHRCWLEGKGPHELLLTLSVRIRKQLPSRRIQLELPATIVRDLKLIVPFARVSVEASEQATVKIRSLSESHTENRDAWSRVSARCRI